MKVDACARSGFLISLLTAEAPKSVLQVHSVFLPKHRYRCFLRAAKRYLSLGRTPLSGFSSRGLTEPHLPLIITRSGLARSLAPACRTHRSNPGFSILAEVVAPQGISLDSDTAALSYLLQIQLNMHLMFVEVLNQLEEFTLKLYMLILSCFYSFFARFGIRLYLSAVLIT